MTPTRRLAAWLIGLCLGALIAYHLTPALGWGLFITALGGH